MGEWKGDRANINRNGRPPKGETLTDALEATIDKQELANQLNRLVLAGDLGAIKYAYDRIIGTPKQTVDQTVFQELPQGAEIVVKIMDEIRADDK